MNINNLRVSWQELINSSGQLQRDMSDCYIRSLKKIYELQENAEGPVFNHQHGMVVLWDGNLWFLNDDGDVIYPLGHTRGSRSVVKEGDPEEGDITIQCLVDVDELLTNIEAEG